MSVKGIVVYNRLDKKIKLSTVSPELKKIPF